MRICAVIAECNPVHDGHRYLLKTAREITQADALIVLLGGDFVQRGEPAIFPKEQRTRELLQCGADLVICLPVVCSLSSGSAFAACGVRLAADLGVVTDLVFGSESGDLQRLKICADFMRKMNALRGIPPKDCIHGTEEPVRNAADYSAAPLAGENGSSCRSESQNTVPELIRRAMAGGLTYPAAAEKVFHTLYPNAAYAEGPNDMLGASYLAALELYGETGIEPHAVRRISADSAAACRQRILRSDLPYLCADDFSQALLYTLEMNKDHLEDYLDVTPDLARRMRMLLPAFRSWSSYCARVKTRNLTYARVSRCCIHILLGITGADQQRMLQRGAGYARVLGYRRDASFLIGELKKACRVPLILRIPDASEIASCDRPLFEKDLQACELYDLFWSGKQHTVPIPEKSKPVLKI